MIDYEKLKLAHELAEKSGSDISYAYQNKDGQYICWVGLDQLHLEMQVLTQPKPKYEIGQRVWILCDEDKVPVSTIIKDIDCANKIDGFIYQDDFIGYNDWWFECDVYPSRDALIDAQIEYWKGIKDDGIIPIKDMNPDFEGGIQGFKPNTNNLPISTKLVVECDHEPSTDPIRINPGNYFCKKCEEFYRD